jgi:hypothetical protein
VKRLPPARVCLVCHASYRGYTDECPICRRDGRENTAALVEVAREQRLGRRQERLDALEERPAPVPYNEFPDGY